MLSKKHIQAYSYVRLKRKQFAFFTCPTIFLQYVIIFHVFLRQRGVIFITVTDHFDLQCQQCLFTNRIPGSRKITLFELPVNYLPLVNPIFFVNIQG